MSIESDKIKSKIEKLLSLASNNNQAGEMELALLKAQELMYKYNISSDEVGQEKVELIEKVIIEKYYKHDWKSSLARVIAENFKCFTYRTETDLIIFGKESDVSIAILIYNYGIVDIVINQSAYRTIRDKNSYAHGFIEGLKEKFKKQVQQFGLIITKDAIVTQEYENIKRKYNLVTQKVIPKYSYNGAYDRGFTDGKNAYTSSVKAIERKY